MKHQKLLVLVEGAVMVALAAVLSYVRVIKLPVGGSVTLLSMLPIILFSIRHGVKQGFFVAFAFSLFQFAQGISDGLFGWGLTPGALTACILFDYLVAFSVLGIGGLFRKHGAVGWVSGTFLACALRYCCHIFSGVFVWKSVGALWGDVVINNVWLYSIVYNGTFMLPEILFTMVGTFLLFRVPQTRRLIATA